MSNRKDGADKAAPIGKDGKAPADENQGAPGQDTAVTGGAGEKVVAGSASIMPGDMVPGLAQGSMSEADRAALSVALSAPGALTGPIIDGAGANDPVSVVASIMPGEPPQNPQFVQVVAQLAQVPSERTEPGLRIASRSPEGFRRAGRRFGPESVDIALGELSDDEIAQLHKEGRPGGRLVVMKITMPMHQPDMDDDQ